MAAERPHPSVVSADDEAVEIVNPDGGGAFVLACEHASRLIPAEFAGLGLDATARQSHIAWDPGALAVARTLSRRLDSPLVAARYSRLLYDCNRPPEAASAIPETSESYDIPGNRALSAEARAARAARFYRPFHDALAATLDRRPDHTPGRAPALVTIHSFTSVYDGIARDLDIGILHDEDSRLADALLAATASAPYTLRRNEPYGPRDGVTHSLRTHALPRGLANVMIEIRNDLLPDAAAQQAMAEWLSEHLERALNVLESKTGTGDAA